MGKGSSIFDRESTVLGRPLSATDKVRMVSKYVFISSLIVLTPVLLFNYWDISRLYENPNHRVFEDVKFKVGRAPKGSETRVVIFNNGAKIFSSSCDGIEIDICNKEEFWKPSLAKFVQVIEISPNRGIIESIAVAQPSGDHVFTNSEADNYVKNYSKKNYHRDWIMLLISAVAGIIFFVSKFLFNTNQKGK